MLRFNKNIKIGDRMIGPDHPTYFIAEIGGNFDGRGVTIVGTITNEAVF